MLQNPKAYLNDENVTIWVSCTLIQEKLERAQEEQAADVGSSVTVDVLAKALGDEKPGKIRGVGYGVTKTKMVVKSHYKKIIKECQVNMMEMNQRLAQLEVRTLLFSFRLVFFSR